MRILAGLSQVDITPPVGIRLVGYHRPGPSAGVLERLAAAALVLQWHGTTAVLLAVDNAGMLVEHVQPFRTAVARELDIPESHVMVMFTHTYSGPETLDVDEIASAYRRALLARILDAVRGAAASLRPCTVGWGVSSGRIGVNRRERGPDGSIRMGRNPSRPVDHRIGVLKIAEADP